MFKQIHLSKVHDLKYKRIVAKKKKTAFVYFFKTPLSFKTVIGVSIGMAALVAVNYTAIIQKTDSPAVFSKISQNELQNVLGTSLSIGEKPVPKNSSTANPVILYWLEVIKEKPFYRDAYHALAITSFNEHDCQATQYYVQKIQEIDPNYSEFKKLNTQLSSCY